jgi:hypothetical protein
VVASPAPAAATRAPGDPSVAPTATGEPGAPPAESSTDPNADPPDPADAIAGGTTGDGGSADGPTSGSALPVALAGGALVGLAGGAFLFLASRRRSTETASVPETIIASTPDHEQLLADALAARGGRRAGAGSADRVPLWVRRLDPELPAGTGVAPDLDEEPGESL